MKDMVPTAVPLGVSGSGLLVITIAITIAGVLLYVLFRGEADYAREHPEDRELELAAERSEHDAGQRGNRAGQPGHAEQQAAHGADQPAHGEEPPGDGHEPPPGAPPGAI